MKEPRYHPLAFVAFLLAVFVLVAPTQADIVFVSLHLGRTTEALLTIVGSIAIVALPLLVAQRSTKRNPDKWKPRFLMKLTWGIIVLNILFNAMLLLNLKGKPESEQSPGPYPGRRAGAPSGSGQE